MEFQAVIKMDNAAFEENGGTEEIRKRIRHIADQINTGITYSNIRDTNGNIVGKWEITEE